VTGPAITVVAVSAEHADHRPYARAVRRALRARGILVPEMTVTASADGLREATLMLRLPGEADTEPVPELVVASWDEETGWGLRLADQPPAGEFSEGTRVLPDPGEVAAWAVIALTYPALAAAGPDRGRFRDHAISDPSFESRLASYAPRR
jgi:hypothetical protein